MNLIASGFVDEIFVKIIYRLIENVDVNFIEYYFEKTHINFGERVQAHGQYYADLQEGKYDCDWSKVIPLDKEIIETMSDCEQVVMKMLDRNDIWSPLTYAERKSLYLKHLRYWNDVIITRKIDIALFSGIPHGVFDYVAYALCKKKNIPVLLFACPALLTDVVFIAESWEDPAPQLGVRYAELISEGALVDIDQLTLGEKFEEHLTAQAKKDGDPPIPYHMSQAWFDNNKEPTYLGILVRRILGLLARPVNFLSKLGSPKFWVRKMRVEYLIRRQKNIVKDTARYYDAHANRPDIGKKFIYVPLQQQPEMTTSPMAGVYVDQHLMIQQLSAFVPEDVLIYVKEHPYQHWGGVAGREIADYEQILKLKNVRFIPKTFSTYRLLDNCIAVATSTGTAGWEGLFKEKPFLMFGHHIYQYAPGVFSIRSNEDCQKAIAEILNGVKPSLAEMRVFLRAMEDVAIIGYTDGVRRQITAVSDQDNVANLADALRDRMMRLGVC